MADIEEHRGYFEERLDWVRQNLKTTNEWHLEDYKDFYERDVKVLIGYIEFLKVVGN